MRGRVGLLTESCQGQSCNFCHMYSITDGCSWVALIGCFFGGVALVACFDVA